MLAERLLEFINQAVPNPEHLSSYDRDTIVEHLMSEEIKMKAMSDLSILTEDMLPTWMGTVPRRLLVQAAKAVSTEATGRNKNAIETASHNLQQPGPSSSSMPLGNIQPVARPSGIGRRSNLPEFRFRVPWTSIPKGILEKIQEKNSQKKPVHNETLKDFKVSIGKILLEEYNTYKENNPSSFKTPGVDIYRSIADEVILKYPYAFQESLHGVIYSDGKENFIKKLEIFVENKCRTSPGERNSVALIKQAKGVPGIIQTQYAPPLTSMMQTKQTLMRQKLKQNFEEGPNFWNLTRINTLMEGSYELQRKDIIDCRKAVLTGGDTDSDDEFLNDEPENRAMNVVLDQWPFLFQVTYMNNHNKRLSGLDLQDRLQSFCNRKPLQYLSLFLTTSSKANMQNLAMKLNLEAELESVSNSSLFLLCFQMLANHFKEDHKFFLKEVEKTIHPDDLGDLSFPNHPIIISIGDFYFDNNGFWVMVDNVCVAKLNNAIDAYATLLNMFFVFDLEYPALMPFTFEFIERIILELAISNSRVRTKKGKVVLVLSKPVKELGDEFFKFCEYMDVHLN